LASSIEQMTMLVIRSGAAERGAGSGVSLRSPARTASAIVAMHCRAASNIIGSPTQAA